MERVEKTNAVVVRGQKELREGPPRRNSYVIEVDRERNCYACREFGHIAQYCRNRRRMMRIGEGKRLEYRRKRERTMKHSDNLKEEKNLEFLD